MNISVWLQRSAQTWSAEPAIAQGTRVVCTYAEMARQVAEMAGALAARGVRPGDRIGLFMANHPRYLLALWGIWWCGGIAVPINARLHGKEAAWIIGHSGCTGVFVDEEHHRALAPELPSGFDLLAPENFDATGLPLPLYEVPESSPAWLFYTSGTTGRPKGVTLTHGNLRWATLAYTATVQAVHPGQCFLHPAPLSHGSGLYHLPYVMNAGLNVVPVSGGFDAQEFFVLAKHWCNASTFAAPTIVKRLAEHATATGLRPEGLATIVYGGAPMYLADFEAARSALGPHLAQIYGQGESPMTITVLPKSIVETVDHPQWRERMASVGVAQPVVEVSVRDDHNQPLPVGAVGEVCVRGPVVMAGYWQDSQATAHALREGWLWTGDVGRLDEAGFLTLLDRSKDLVISGGNNIYPREIEEVLLQHPAVREASVIGRPDAQWGESLVAFVVPNGPVQPAELDAHCLAHLARYKRPKAYRLVTALPKNHYGKVLKTELREQEARRAQYPT
jgi:long-chain acyl-CoA synthetase